MKNILAIILVLCCSVVLAQGRKKPVKQAPIKPKNKIDTLMIKRTGADPYGMHKYVMCFLKTGPNKTLSQDSTKKILMGHMKNMEALSNQGKLVLAGPFTDRTEWEGIFIFNCTTVEEAQKWVDTDPGVRSGLFSAELHTWYGTAVLMDVPLLHTKVQAKTF